jgi:hypothetical protein
MYMNIIVDRMHTRFFIHNNKSISIITNLLVVKSPIVIYLSETIWDLLSLFRRQQNLTELQCLNFLMARASNKRICKTWGGGGQK